MSTYQDKTHQPTRVALQEKNLKVSTFQLMDNRHEAAQQRRQHMLANSSDQVKQLMGYQEKVNLKPQENDHPAQNPFPIQKVNNTGLPNTLKSGIENLSGFAMDDVKVHYRSSKPASIQAHAYAQGTDIHLGPGQEKHLPHEAWHVVQQKQGRVKPTQKMPGGVPVNTESRLEHEATHMGNQAIMQKASKYKATKNTTTTPVLQGLFGYETWNSLKSMVSYVGSGAKDAYQFGKQGVNDSLNYLWDGTKGSYEHAKNVGAGSMGHIKRGVSGSWTHTKQGLSGIKDYAYDGISGTASHLLKLWPVIKSKSKNQIGQYIMDGITGPISYGKRGLMQSLAHSKTGLFDSGNYLLDGSKGFYNHTKAVGAGSLGHVKRGLSSSFAYTKQGLSGIKDFNIQGAKNLYDGVGYFRTIAMLAGLGAGGVATGMGLPLAQIAMATAGGTSLPYLRDFYKFLRLSSNYEPNTPGYHSIERHSAWYRRGNIKKRLVPLLFDNRTSEMKDWSGWMVGKNVGKSTTSSQFLTSNWHQFSKDKAIAHLKTIDPAAVLMDHKPLQQIPGHSFTIQYPNWYTGISHTNATPPEGQGVSFVFSNFIKPRLPLNAVQLGEQARITALLPGNRTKKEKHNLALLNAAAAGNAYFLVQHYPQAGASGQPNDSVDHTKMPI